MDFNAPLRPSLLQLCDAQAIPSGATQLPGTRPGATLPNRALTWNQARICSHAEGYTTSSNHVQDCPDMLKNLQTCSSHRCHMLPQKATKIMRRENLESGSANLLWTLWIMSMSAAKPAKGTCITKWLEETPRYKSTTLGTASRSNFKDKLPNARGLRVFHWSHWVIAFVPFMFLSCSNCSVHGSYFAMSQSDILMMSMLQSNQRNSICVDVWRFTLFLFQNASQLVIITKFWSSGRNKVTAFKFPSFSRNFKRTLHFKKMLHNIEATSRRGYNVEATSNIEATSRGRYTSRRCYNVEATSKRRYKKRTLQSMT